MLEDSGTLLTKIHRAMIQSAPSGWSRLELFASAAGCSMDLTNWYIDSRGDRATYLGSPQDDILCMELREIMYQRGKGTWYHARFQVQRSGTQDVEYDYDSIPFSGDVDEDVRNLLIEDQKLFPRDQNSLPLWHPSSKG
jgi:hypothetical protein